MYCSDKWILSKFQKESIKLLTSLHIYLPGQEFPEINDKSCRCRQLLLSRLSRAWEGRLACHCGALLLKSTPVRPSPSETQVVSPQEVTPGCHRFALLNYIYI